MVYFKLYFEHKFWKTQRCSGLNSRTLYLRGLFWSSRLIQGNNVALPISDPKQYYSDSGWNGKGAEETTGLWDLSTLCFRVIRTVAVPLRALWFKALLWLSVSHTTSRATCSSNNIVVIFRDMCSAVERIMDWRRCNIYSFPDYAFKVANYIKIVVS